MFVRRYATTNAPIRYSLPTWYRQAAASTYRLQPVRGTPGAVVVASRSRPEDRRRVIVTVRRMDAEEIVRRGLPPEEHGPGHPVIVVRAQEEDLWVPRDGAG